MVVFPRIPVNQERLHVACRTGDLKTVKDLINSGANPIYEFDTPFNEACVGGSMIVAKYLYTLKGWNVHADSWNNYSICMALQNGHLELADWLITLPGVTPHVLENKALRKAVERGDTAVVGWINNH